MENFIQATLQSIPSPGAQGATLVIGGDGRYYNDIAIQKIIKISCASQVFFCYLFYYVSKLVIGQNGILSTPATSYLIRKLKATGKNKNKKFRRNSFDCFT